MRRYRITRAMILAVVASLAASRPAAAQYTCPLAPVHGPICRYVDPRLLKVLASEAGVEAFRWGALEILRPKIERVTARTDTGATRLTEYDSTLRLLKTPTVPPPSVFAATWNLTHPTADVRFVVANGTMREVNFGALASGKVDSLQALGANDPVVRVADNIATLARSIPEYGSSKVAQQLVALYRREQEARTRDSVAAVRATGLAAASRARSEGMQGESEGRLLQAQATLQLMRASADQQRSDASAQTIDGLRASQQTRAARAAMIGRWARFNTVVTP